MNSTIESIRVGKWVVIPRLNKIQLASSANVHVVTPKVMALLTTLIENRNSPLSVDELAQRVWPDRVVSDNSVYQAVAMLRKVLNEESDIDYIERISGQGYRLSTEIDVFNLDSNVVDKKKKTHAYLYISTLFAVLIVLLIIYVFGQRQQNDLKSDPHFEAISLAEHLTKSKLPERITKAKQIYTEVLEGSPEHVVAMSGLCNTHMALAIYGSLPESQVDALCRPLLFKALELDSNNADVLTSLARLETLSRKFDQAKVYFEQALSLSNESPMLWHWYGRFHREKNNLDKALDAHLKAFRLAPNNPTVLRGLAYTYLNRRDLKNARKYFERSVEIAPHAKHIALYQLDFHLLNEQRAKAYKVWYEKHMTEYSRVYPLHKLSHILFLLSIGNLEEAIQKSEEIQITRQNVTSFNLYVRAGLKWYQQDKQGAIGLLKQRYLLAPEDNHYAMPYIMGLYQTRQYSAAKQLFEKHFRSVSRLNRNVNEHVGVYLLYAMILKKLEQGSKVQEIRALIADHLNGQTKLDIRYQPFWYSLNEEPEQLKTSLFKLLDSGWLPDTNDNIFAIEMHSELIDEVELRDMWLNMLNTTQADLQ
ncbi:winged helix-turn-helix domain-containing protein [Pseudoalteromonas sp. Of7M-16]|uniref:winged helix-turn-helix domain-containing protein n=1 Tax=Pseudoalteromonas sp. Of7M-16 TaxID=2917756 RepID=UPI001EF71133|nr:winged helix-turn-helix domain-containing protein [Pseudoalteromonas sp. Of7M-16]MCG7547705.1 winged helix-turn-helix domain-containing protein [Pseudoalteromonas sp. Of7M-16]